MKPAGRLWQVAFASNGSEGSLNSPTPLQRSSSRVRSGLKRLINGPAATYVHVARHALAQQRKARRDFEYDAPSVADLRAVMTDDLPETIDDMRAYLADRIEVVQERIHRDHTDMWAVYWVDNRPRPENFCRARLVEQISNQLPDSIRLEPEAQMSGQRRADLVASRNAIRLPVEIKGQWHRDVWHAASDQLDARYAREWRAGGCGVYVVLWFGDVQGKQLYRHPDGVAPPETPRELQRAAVRADSGGATLADRRGRDRCHASAGRRLKTLRPGSRLRFHDSATARSRWPRGLRRWLVVGTGQRCARCLVHGVHRDLHGMLRGTGDPSGIALRTLRAQGIQRLHSTDAWNPMCSAA